MMSAELALQGAVRARLIGDAGVLALVPAASILDRNERPNPRPSIVIGEAQSVDENDSISRNRIRVYLDLHVWTEELSTEVSKRLVGAIRTALKVRPVLGTGYQLADCRIRQARFLRDPDGKTAHAVVTVDALVAEAL